MTTPTRVTEEELAKWEALASAYKAAPKTLIPGKEWSNFVAAFDADAILRLIASHRALEKRVGEWQPIETAPTDGTWILLFYNIACVPQMTFWSRMHQDWAHRKEMGNNAPTHWQPLPEPPAAPGQEG